MKFKKIFLKGKNPTEKDKMTLILFSSSTALVLNWMIFFVSTIFLSSENRIMNRFFTFEIIISLLLLSSMAYSIRWFIRKKWKKQ